MPVNLTGKTFRIIAWNPQISKLKSKPKIPRLFVYLEVGPTGLCLQNQQNSCDVILGKLPQYQCDQNSYCLAMILFSLKVSFSNVNSSLNSGPIFKFNNILKWEWPRHLWIVIFLNHYIEKYCCAKWLENVVKLSADLCQNLKFFKWKGKSDFLKICFILIPKW